MTDYERPFMDRVWEFTKDISVKVSRKAEKYWKINTLRVEIASIKHRISVKYKELGRFVYESLKSGSPDETSYKSTMQEYYDEISHLENEIYERESRIETLEMQLAEEYEESPPPPVEEDFEERLAREIDEAPADTAAKSNEESTADEETTDDSSAADEAVTQDDEGEDEAKPDDNANASSAKKSSTQKDKTESAKKVAGDDDSSEENEEK